jgi:hypothetical protein
MASLPAFSRAFRLRFKTRRTAVNRRMIKKMTSKAKRRNYYEADICLELDNQRVRTQRVPCARWVN